MSWAHTRGSLAATSASTRVTIDELREQLGARALHLGTHDFLPLPDARALVVAASEAGFAVGALELFSYDGRAIAQRSLAAAECPDDAPWPEVVLRRHDHALLDLDRATREAPNASCAVALQAPEAYWARQIWRVPVAARATDALRWRLSRLEDLARRGKHATHGPERDALLTELVERGEPLDQTP